MNKIEEIDSFIKARLAEQEELHRGDTRTPAGWDDQECLCGKKGWCGRDSHRPDFAVDECNSTVFFPSN